LHVTVNRHIVDLFRILVVNERDSSSVSEAIMQIV